MAEPSARADDFVERFMDRKVVERYRNRYFTGRHARINQVERAALRELLGGLGRMSVALDLPSGVGRLSDVLAEHADRVILADSSPLMLEVAKQDLGDKYEYRQENAEQIDLPTGSVDLVFCHRLLNHVPDPQARARMVKELTRIVRKYVVISCYPAGYRTRMRTALRRILGKEPSSRKPANIDEYIELAGRSGLRVVKRHVLRRFPSAAELVLFEKAE